VYGLLIVAYPVAALNLVIAVIHTVSLRRLTTSRREKVSFLPVAADDPYLERFLDFHAEDLERFHGPDLRVGDAPVVGFLLRDMVPAGLLVARPDGSDLVVEVDYVIPRYRDLVLGRYLFAHLDEFMDTGGIRRVVTDAGIPEHEKYLARIGFAPDGSGRWALPLG
ncbi:MAG: hypothetical protein HKN46_03365, partial [Acidimicrobiia bacterium]|nr:hypothetical protein [Acidimicrobiia bacterium]